MIQNAIILAAGKGSRLVEATFGSPKPLVDINGISLILINGFGILSVMGRNLLPLPPAKINAFICLSFCFWIKTYLIIHIISNVAIPK